MLGAWWCIIGDADTNLLSLRVFVTVVPKKRPPISVCVYLWACIAAFVCFHGRGDAVEKKVKEREAELSLLVPARLWCAVCTVCARCVLADCVLLCVVG